MRNISNIKGVLYAVVSSATFGLIPLFSIPLLHAGMASPTILFYRMLLSAAIMAAVALLLKRNFRISRRDFGVLAGLSLMYAATSLGLLRSYDYIPSGVATTVNFLYPLVVTIVMTLFFRERSSVWIVIAVFISLVGVALLAWGDAGNNDPGRGLIYAGTTVFTYAVYIIGVMKSRAGRLDPLIVAFYVLTFSAAVFLVYALSTSGIAVVHTWHIWRNLLLLALLPTVLSNLTLVHRLEVFAVGRTHIGHFGRNAEGHVPAGERNLIADHRGEIEVVGVRSLKVDGRGRGLQVAERRHVASEGQPLERHVSRAQTGRIAALRAAAEVGVHVNHHAAQRPRVGDRLHEETRSRGVHHQLLFRIVIARHGNVVGHEVDVVHDAVEVVSGAQAHEAAQRKREPVVLRREYELGLLGLLEAGAVRLDIVLRGVVHRQPVERRGLTAAAAAAVVNRVHFVHGDEIDRGRILSVAAVTHVSLGRSGRRKQQSHNQKSKCFHKPNKIWFFG